MIKYIEDFGIDSNLDNVLKKLLLNVCKISIRKKYITRVKNLNSYDLNDKCSELLLDEKTKLKTKIENILKPEIDKLQTEINAIYNEIIAITHKTTELSAKYAEYMVQREQNINLPESGGKLWSSKDSGLKLTGAVAGGNIFDKKAYTNNSFINNCRISFEIQDYGQ